MKEYPKWMYGPNGEGRIFEENDTVPEGWQDHPSKVKAPKKQATLKNAQQEVPKKTAAENATDAERTEENARYRTEAIAFLKSAGADVSDTISDEELTALMDRIEAEGKSGA